MSNKSFALTADDMMLLGACMMAAKNRIIDLKLPDKKELCEHIDAIAQAIQDGKPLSVEQAQEAGACVEAVRRRVYKDPILPIRQRRVVIDHCSKLIAMFTNFSKGALS